MHAPEDWFGFCCLPSANDGSNRMCHCSEEGSSNPGAVCLLGSNSLPDILHSAAAALRISTVASTMPVHSVAQLSGTKVSALPRLVPQAVRIACSIDSCCSARSCNMACTLTAVQPANGSYQLVVDLFTQNLGEHAPCRVPWKEWLVGSPAP